MTDQLAETIVNEHPAVHLGAWRVYGAIRGTPAKDNHGWGDRVRVYRAEPAKVEVMKTSNWKGYVERWRLQRDGRLVLDAIVYDDDRIPPLVTNEPIDGDLFLVLKSTFQGPRLWIRFVSGIVVLDTHAWLHEAYVGPSPVQTEIVPGPHPDFPGPARLWHELDFPPDTLRDGN